MRLVVLSKQQTGDLSGFALPDLRQFLLEKILEEEFFPQPDGHSRGERAETAGGVCEIGLEQTLELDQRFVVEDHMIDVVEGETRLVEAEANRVLRETLVMLLARESLFLGGGGDFPVLDQGRRAIVIKR